MKRTQSVILVLLALSLAACSHLPWRNNSGTSPAASPSAGSPPAASTGDTGAGSTTAKSTTGPAAGSVQN